MENIETNLNPNFQLKFLSFGRHLSPPQ